MGRGMAAAGLGRRRARNGRMAVGKDAKCRTRRVPLVTHRRGLDGMKGGRRIERRRGGRRGGETNEEAEKRMRRRRKGWRGGETNEEAAKRMERRRKGWRGGEMDEEEGR